MDRTINTALLWTAPKIKVEFLEGVFTFNGFNLDNWKNVRVVSSNHDDIGTMDFDTYKTPLQDWGWVLWKYYRKKTIDLVLSIKADTPEEFNDLIDEIKYQTSQTEWTLKITINWKTREWKATCTSLKFNRNNYNLTWIWNVALTFTCVNPHSQERDPLTTNFIWKSWTFQSSIIYEWKAETYPKLYLTMDSGSSAWMMFELNWFVIQINETLTAWDVIVFDWETKSVFVNNVEVVYTWPFTPLTYWENIYSITNDWTFSGSLIYFVKFL